MMLVTMATPRTSHVKGKNSIFTARDEDMIFLVKGKILVFHQYLYSNKVYYPFGYAYGENTENFPYLYRFLKGFSWDYNLMTSVPQAKLDNPRCSLFVTWVQ